MRLKAQIKQLRACEAKRLAATGQYAETALDAYDKVLALLDGSAGEGETAIRNALQEIVDNAVGLPDDPLWIVAQEAVADAKIALAAAVAGHETPPQEK